MFKCFTFRLLIQYVRNSPPKERQQVSSLRDRATRVYRHMVSYRF